MTMDWDAFNKKTIDEFRANKGRVGGSFEGAPMVVLHTKGAKSGKERVIPLMALRDDGRTLVFASKGGAPTHPDWYRNLVANPDVTVEEGEEKYEAKAEVLKGEERNRLYEKQSKAYPQFGEYQKNTKRTIPVIALNRKDKK